VAGTAPATEKPVPQKSGNTEKPRSVFVIENTPNELKWPGDLKGLSHWQADEDSSFEDDDQYYFPEVPKETKNSEGKEKQKNVKSGLVVDSKKDSKLVDPTLEEKKSKLVVDSEQKDFKLVEDPTRQESEFKPAEDSKNEVTQVEDSEKKFKPVEDSKKNEVKQVGDFKEGNHKNQVFVITQNETVVEKVTFYAGKKPEVVNKPTNYEALVRELDLEQYDQAVGWTKANDKAIYTLLDSGAGACLIDNTAAKRKNLKLEEYRGKSIVDANNNGLKIVGTSVIKWSLLNREYDLPVVVVDKLPFDLIVGSPMMNVLGAKLDYKENRFYVGDEWIPIQRKRGKPLKIRAREEVVLEKWSQKFIPCEIDGPVNQNLCYNVVPSIFTRSQLKIGHGVSEWPHSNVVLSNWSQKDVTIKKGALLGYLQEKVSSDQIFEIRTEEDFEKIKETIRIGGSFPNKTRKKIIERIKNKMRAFGVGETFTPGAVKGVEHHIRLKEDAKPVKQRHRRGSPDETKIMNEHVDDMLKRKITRPSKSPWASPVVLVKKKDGTMRFAVDYRKVNSMTIKDSFPLPYIQDTLDNLAGASISY
jgi:chorismate mutase